MNCGVGNCTAVIDMAKIISGLEDDLAQQEEENNKLHAKIDILKQQIKDLRCEHDESPHRPLERPNGRYL